MSSDLRTLVAEVAVYHDVTAAQTDAAADLYRDLLAVCARHGVTLDTVPRQVNLATVAIDGIRDRDQRPGGDRD